MPSNIDDQSAIRRLIETFGALTPDLTNLGPDAVLSLITKRALEAIPTATTASISRAKPDTGFETVAPTDQLALDVDAIQYDVGRGPCVDAATTSSIFLTGDLRTDERWPEFGRRAVEETGVLSMLAFRLYIEDDDYRAALNLYSREPDAFDEQDRLSGIALATYGALAIIGSRRLERIVNLERALASNRDIGVAIGVLMGLHRITRDQAFDLLRMASQARHRKLSDIARSVAETGSLDPV